MSTVSNHNSIAEIILYRLTTTDKGYCENHKLSHKALVQCVEHCVPGSIIDSVVTYIPKLIIANALGISKNSLTSLSGKMLNRNQTDVLEDVSATWYQMRRFFNFDESSLQEWVNTPLPGLSGAAPATLMSTIAGRKEVRDLLATMCHGDFG